MSGQFLVENNRLRRGGGTIKTRPKDKRPRIQCIRKKSWIVEPHKCFVIPMLITSWVSKNKRRVRESPSLQCGSSTILFYGHENNQKIGPPTILFHGYENNQKIGLHKLLNGVSTTKQNKLNAYKFSKHFTQLFIVRLRATKQLVIRIECAWNKMANFPISDLYSISTAM